jgi:beta-lactamase class A
MHVKPRSALTAAILTLPALLFAAGPARAAAAPAVGPATASPPVCTSSSHPALAARISQAIRTARQHRVSFTAVEVDDPSAGLLCRFHATSHFDSASVVKVMILAALLRKAQAEHRALTRTERALAWAMITQSDNDAASALWADTGRTWLRRFMTKAKMTHTHLDPGGAWGLTRITADDETRLLWLLLKANRVLNTSSRHYALALMAKVTPSQRWGVPAGAPERLVVHVKNGWLPLAPYGWRINSIGGFTASSNEHSGQRYSIVVLTQDNPTMDYGVDTVEAIARAVNRALNPGTIARVRPAEISPAQETPDEPIP